jgi:hypothetical protein
MGQLFAAGFRSEGEQSQHGGSRKDQWYVIHNHAAPLVAPQLLPVHNNRFAANRHSSTDADVTTIRVMLTKLPSAVENIRIPRPAASKRLALRTRVFPDRFLAAM